MIQDKIIEQPTPSQSEQNQGEAVATVHCKNAELFGYMTKAQAKKVEIGAKLYTKQQPTSQEVVDAVLAEREACAKICLDLSAEFYYPLPLVRASNHILARNERE